MSRSGYTDECDDNFASIRWRGAVNSAIKGKRGQAFLRELLAALDAMPDKRLAEGDLEVDGDFCALGVIGKARGIDISNIDTEDYGRLSSVFGISEALAREIMWENDESVDNFKREDFELCGPVRPWQMKTVWQIVPDPDAQKKRWQYMRSWVQANLKEPKCA